MANNVKFYNSNQIDSIATFTFTTANSALSSYLYDNDRTTKLPSIGSNDATTETYLIEFSTSKTFDAVHIDNHNIKSGDVMYWNGFAYVDFSTAATWSSNSASSTFFSFNSVSTTKLRIRMNTTIIANAQKYIGEIRAFAIIGTVSANPTEASPEFIERSVQNQGAVGGNIYILFGKKYHVIMRFNDAPIADVLLFLSLKELGKSFYVYPGGGDNNIDVGFRIQDIFLVNYVNPFSPAPKSNLLGVGSVIELELSEV